MGAVVSPTDAVAASATAKLLGLARRIVTVIEGESMVNDATGLVVYRFAVATVVTGSFSLRQASLQLVVVSLGGLLIGLLISWPVAWLHRHLDDAPIEIAITLLTPYAAYLVADAFQVSYESAVKRIIFSDREGHWSQCKIVCWFAKPYEKGPFLPWHGEGVARERTDQQHWTGGMIQDKACHMPNRLRPKWRPSTLGGT